MAATGCCFERFSDPKGTGQPCRVRITHCLVGWLEAQVAKPTSGTLPLVQQVCCVQRTHHALPTAFLCAAGIVQRRPAPGLPRHLLQDCLCVLCGADAPAALGPLLVLPLLLHNQVKSGGGLALCAASIRTG